jgi:hypothetical protein
MRGVLGLAIELWTFGSPGGLQILTFSKCWASPPHLAKVGLRQLESWWTPKSLESNCRGKNPLDWGVHYIIGKILERKCLKWARTIHLDTSNVSYGQKKGRESKWQFDSRPLKVGNRPNFLACKQRVTYCWKSIDKSYNFASNFISIRGLHAKLWAPKSQEFQLWEFRDSHLGVLGQNAIWVFVLWLGTNYTTRGKVVDSPKSGPWWVLWV